MPRDSIPTFCQFSRELPGRWRVRMAQRVFAVVLSEGSQAGLERLKEKYKTDFLGLTPNVGLVRVDDMSAAVATVAGIPRNDADLESEASPAEGIVFEVAPSKAAGYTYTSVWAWLREARQDS